MTGKLGLLVGFGAGYVLGARAGRERYEQIADRMQRLWHDPRMREKVGQAQHAVQDKAEQVFDHMSSSDEFDPPTPERAAAGKQSSLP